MSSVAWMLGIVAALAIVCICIWTWSMRRRSLDLERVLADADRKLEHLQREFERFVPADVVERLTDDRDTGAPERRQVTMMFADLRGFT